jgi:hypothetical protein
MLLASIRLGFLTVAAAIVFASVTAAAQSTFRITQIFSSFDGTFQYIELTESAGLDGQHHFAGLTLTSRYAGFSKQFMFPHDLPTTRTGGMSIIVSVTDNLWVLDLRPTYTALQPYYPQFMKLPRRFIPVEAATLDFAGFDSISYAALPTDGTQALYRGGTVGKATLPDNGQCFANPCQARYNTSWHGAFAIEYYNGALDHYFITAWAPEIDAIETGRHVGWSATGDYFLTGTVPGSGQPVCRFYMPPGQGDSHFLSSDAAECEAVGARYPNFVLETDATFYVAGTNPANGLCPPDDGSGIYGVPVYRLWNQRVDSNHRYTTKESTRDEMTKRGYSDEGIAWCYWVSIWDY